MFEILAIFTLYNLFIEDYINMGVMLFLMILLNSKEKRND